MPTAEPGYTVTYETRPGSAAYLDFPTEAASLGNIDYFHMYRALECIEAWFSEQKNETLAAIEMGGTPTDRGGVAVRDRAVVVDDDLLVGHGPRDGLAVVELGCLLGGEAVCLVPGAVGIAAAKGVAGFGHARQRTAPLEL